MTEQPLNFDDANQRNAWIIENAESFTAFRMLNRQRQRMDAASIDEARSMAKTMLIENPKPVLIYAVNGLSDTFVEMVKT